MKVARAWLKTWHKGQASEMTEHWGEVVTTNVVALQRCGVAQFHGGAETATSLDVSAPRLQSAPRRATRDCDAFRHIATPRLEARSTAVTTVATSHAHVVRPPAFPSPCPCPTPWSGPAPGPRASSPRGRASHWRTSPTRTLSFATSWTALPRAPFPPIAARALLRPRSTQSL